jgi:hypothetical protein
MAQGEESPIQPKWEGDHLDRVESARFLTTYLNGIYHEENKDAYAGYFVLNLNANWGQGKSFLIEKWVEDLKQAKYPVVLFDAWKNDFSKDPLVGFIAELEKALGPWLDYVAPAQALMANVMGTAKKLIGIGTRLFAGPIAGEIVEKITGLDGIDGSIADQAGKLADKALSQHRETRRLIEEFKTNLRALIETIEQQQKHDLECDVQLPLYIFVDELDRCRPTYAIELLENIKQLFGVRGVFFIIATNKEQLCHSIGAVYGSGFDSSSYLGRFFDQEYTLPEPNNRQYAKFLFDKYQIVDVERLVTPFHNDKEHPPHLQATFAAFSDAFKLSLRDQGQTAHRLKAILSVCENEILYFDYLVFLLMLKKKSEPLLNQISSQTRFDQNHFKEALSRIFNLHMPVRIPLMSQWGNLTREADQSIYELVDKYLQKLSQTKWAYTNAFRGENDEQFRTEFALLKESQRTNSKVELFSFIEYPNLVNQVGHLS